MIFRQELIDKILAGEKTVTRRPVKTTATGVGTPSMATPLNLLVPCRYEVGKTYAVQPGRGQKAVGRIRVVAVDKEELRCISWHEARNEGFANVAAFLRYWRRLYGHVNPSQLVWRIEFKLIEQSSQAREG